MKNNSFLLNTLLAGILGLALLICVLVRTFLPGAVLPVLNIPAMTGLCQYVDGCISNEEDAKDVFGI